MSKLKFSIVIIAYNVETYLRAAIESALSQTYENIEVICVDDCSADGSKTIIEEFAKKDARFIPVLSEKNEGCVSARKRGVEKASGDYVLFLDGDDELAENACETLVPYLTQDEAPDVLQFSSIVLPASELHENYAAGLNGYMNCYEEGFLFEDLVIKTFLCRKFPYNVWGKAFKTEILREACAKFSMEHIVIGEDAYIASFVLHFAYSYLGIKTEPLYRYYYGRGVTVDIDAVALFTNFNKQVFVLKEIQKFFAAYKLSDKYALAYSAIKDRLLDSTMRRWFARSEAERIETLDSICEAWGAKEILLMLGRLADEKCVNDELLGWRPVYLEFFEFENGKLLIEGYVPIPKKCIPEKFDFRVIARTDEEVPQSINVKMQYGKSSKDFDGTTLQIRTFAAEIFIEEKPIVIQFESKNGDFGGLCTDLFFGRFFPLSDLVDATYLYRDGFSFEKYDTTLYIQKRSKIWPLKRELKIFFEARRKMGLRAGLAIFRNRLCTLKTRVMCGKTQNIWLISDRIMQVDDNGEAFFRYLCENPDVNIRPIFAISKNAPDFTRLSQIGETIDFWGKKYQKYLFAGAMVISSQPDEPFAAYFDSEFFCWYADLFFDRKFVFLQHGVTEKDVFSCGWLSRYVQNISLFITTSKAETDFVRDEYYGQWPYLSKAKVCPVGFPRFDRLYDAKEKQIVIMPTWRQYKDLCILRDENYSCKYLESFFDSEFFITYKKLLNDNTLLSAAEQYGYKICFKPHPMLMPIVERFKTDARLIVLPNNEAYSKIFAETALMVTDYSSAVFDFAWLKKPILYFQFDKERFFSEGAWKEGYFDFERDGFGEVAYDADTLVALLIEYMKTDCELKDFYRERIEKTFAYFDKNNSMRVKNAICEMLGQDIK